jgi:hypothetical protein
VVPEATRSLQCMQSNSNPSTSSRHCPQLLWWWGTHYQSKVRTGQLLLCFFILAV